MSDPFSSMSDAATQHVADAEPDPRSNPPHNWKTRAEAVEARTAPAVTKAEIEKAVRSCPVVSNWNGPRVRARAAIEAVWALVSGDDPVVFVVRESDLPEVTRDDAYGDPRWIAGDVHLNTKISAAFARRCARTMLQRAAGYEAIARAIEAEQATDPVEELAEKIETATRAAIRQACDDLAGVAPSLDPLAVEQAMEVTAVSRKVAAHALGQEEARTERDAAGPSSRWEETDDE